MIKREKKYGYSKKFYSQPFTDGYIEIVHRVRNAPDGWMPTYTEETVQQVRFQERTVGVTRYYSALHNDEHVAIVVRIPEIEFDEDDDILVYNNRYNGKKFSVISYQTPENVYPRVIDLSLGYKTYMGDHDND